MKRSDNDVPKKIINNITFYYYDLVLTDSILEELESFSMYADEEAYSVYLDDGKLVIY